MGNDEDLREMAQICGEMAKLFDNGLKNLENDINFGKWPKHLGNGLDAWGTA